MDAAGHAKRTVIESLFRPLVTGVLALLPIALTVIVIIWVADFMASIIGPGSVFGGFIKRIGWNIGPKESGAYLGGAVLCVRKEWVTRLDCGVDGLFSIYMSMGTAVPDYLKPVQSSGLK